jgi:hypothetical protein
MIDAGLFGFRGDADCPAWWVTEASSAAAWLGRAWRTVSLRGVSPHYNVLNLSVRRPFFPADDRIRRPVAAEIPRRAHRGAHVGIPHRLRLRDAAAARLRARRVRRRESESRHVLACRPRRHPGQHAGRHRRLLDRLPRQGRFCEGTLVALVPLAQALWREDDAAVLGAGHRRSSVHPGGVAAPAVLAQRGLYGDRQVCALRVHDRHAVVRAGWVVEVAGGDDEPRVWITAAAVFRRPLSATLSQTW